jgi:lipoprotein-anchoring transpeptidase ErfK/SrfK
MRLRTVFVSMVLVGVILGGAVVAAYVAWPNVRLGTSEDALGRVDLPSFAGHASAVRVTTDDGRRVPVAVRHGELWPLRQLDQGERLHVTLTVRRPGWAGWAVGRHQTRTFTVVTPTARVRSRLVLAKPGALVTVGFAAPVERVALGGKAQTLERPHRVVVVDTTAPAGSIAVAAAARSWERLSEPVRVSWFPKRPYAQLLARPRAGGTLMPTKEITLEFSAPVRDVLGARPPTLSPPTPGRWRQVDDYTLAFRPAGLGFGLGAHVEVVLPRAVHLATVSAGQAGKTLAWEVPEGTTLRLQQLLAQLGYLPLTWQPASDPGTSPAAQLAAAIDPPKGTFSWRYPNTPPELRANWNEGQIDQITRGAVMKFEDTHGLEVDALAGPRVWRALIADALAGERETDPYSYVFVHRGVPQSLNLWVGGQVILSSPGNTGVPAAPTQLGTFPVFEHIPIGTMSGTNPDGTHYNDPGIRWISYFNHGDAIHAFNRASFGTPQSLGCVELPLAAAAKVYPYTPIGTLVTIED